MKLLSQLRTSSFQLALLYMVVFATSVFLLLAFIYWRTAGFMTAQTDETIEAEIAGLAEQYRGRGVNGLITIIRERVARDPNAKSIYLLTTDDFLKLAGNIETWPGGSRVPFSMMENDCTLGNGSHSTCIWSVLGADDPVAIGPSVMGTVPT